MLMRDMPKDKLLPCSNQANPSVQFPIVMEEGGWLNLLQKEDGLTLFHLVQTNRQYLRQWLPWVDFVQHPRDQKPFIQTENQRWRENKALTLGIWYQQQLVGIISFHPFDWQHRTAGLGYWLDEAHQGKGIMTKACQALIHVGFQWLDLTSVTISCATENYKSQRIPLRLGFVWQQTIAKSEWLYDHYVDHHVYLLQRPDSYRL